MQSSSCKIGADANMEDIIRLNLRPVPKVFILLFLYFELVNHETIGVCEGYFETTPRAWPVWIRCQERRSQSGKFVFDPFSWAFSAYTRIRIRNLTY
ncbi:hypothetical protein AMATHDRAFT_66207 [Amanita thiersii Skay4041]|uniref:Uncharacterized protein n=1 Tax=Amanita thiersii Skay4041 TaxID=703135 RepID=A0A2A9NIJ3_9AGAR|nr:hypothetical protein AMATHDRAFT_66207 [Amanita thiersii Skay4041]